MIIAQDTKSLASVKTVKDAAEFAKVSALEAKTAADEAKTAAGEAYSWADEARNQAAAANAHAVDALYQLGTIEDVVGALSWISEHAVYEPSADTGATSGKMYFIVSGEAVGTAEQFELEQGRYYELTDGKYYPTEDTVVDGTKTYYRLAATTVQNAAGNPAAQGWYQIRSIKESVQNYIASHLALDGAGLHVTTEGTSSSLLVSSDGVTIFGNAGQIVGQYGEGAVIGDANREHISIKNGVINFWDGHETSDYAHRVAYISNNQLYIEKVVVVDSIQAGNWLEDASTEPEHLTTKWIGE